MSGPAVVSVSSSWIQEQFRCCICLDVFRDPVCTPCGHNFCLDCIEGFWETKARPECPLCKEVFSCRPELRVNHSFADIIQHLLRNLPNPEVQRADSPDPCSPDPCSPDPCSPDPSPRRPLEDLLCDVCSEAQAVRSCLVCQTSYCQLHVAPHLCDSVLRRHSLTDPASFPSPHLCRRHQRPLLLYCQKERTAVCESCGHREHKQHRTISVERATRRVKAAVKETKADLQRMIQDRVGKAEQIQQNLDQSKKQTHQEVERSVRRWSLLLCALEQEQRSLVEELQSRQKEVEEEAQQLLSQLQQEVKELQARGADILELESTRHSLHLIQSFPLLSKLPQTRDWDELRVCSDRGLGPVREALSNMRDLCHNLCSEVSAEEVDSLAEHAVDVTFDPDTASGWVEVSADGKKVNVRAQKKKMVVTDSARRFDCCVCVLGREQFTSGRRYWVVEVGEKTDWEVGLARESVQRKGQIQVQPDSGFWSICRRGGIMSACTKPSQPLGPQLAAPQRIGVYVHYERGLVSFYDAQRKTHLFSFTACNLQGAVCPYFNPCVQEDKKTTPLTICAVEREERPERDQMDQREQGEERDQRNQREQGEERDQRDQREQGEEREEGDKREEREQRPEMIVTSL